MEGSGPAAELTVDVFTAEERPDLWEAGRSLFLDVWPEYNLHGNNGQYFATLFPQHARLQVLLYDRYLDRLVGRGRTIPFRWDGSLDDLPTGIDAVGRRALDDPGPATALSALAAEVVPGHQGRGLSRLILEAMAAAARRGGLFPLMAPVRPSWKDRYPLTPIDRYATWRRPDGQLFDPWLRVHGRMGATIVRTEEESLQIEAPIADWEQWTGLLFPEDGEYVFPSGLAPLRIHGGIGSYWEPNVWMRHEL
jgi:GNAT superfamily N-acetyltransferase